MKKVDNCSERIRKNEDNIIQKIATGKIRIIFLRTAIKK